jgi:predicted nucleotidyltransferase
MINVLSSQKAKDILNLLFKGEKTLPEITEYLGISKPATIKYLNEMENIGLISSKMITNSVGRTKTFQIRAFSFVFSLDPIKGGIIYQNSDPIFLDNPLIGQIHQHEFRAKVRIYMNLITKTHMRDFIIILYGSIAQGEGTSKSDIDLLLLSKNEWKKKEKNMIMDALHEGAIKTQVQVKPLFWTLRDFLSKRDNLTKSIKNEGMILKDNIEDENLWKTMKRYWNIPD